MQSNLNGTIKTVITTVVALALVAVLANLILWQIYKMNICEPLYTDATNAEFSYDEDLKTYSAVVGKYNASIKEPSLLKFDCTIEFAEKSATVWKANGETKQILLIYKIVPSFTGEMEHQIWFEDITSSAGALNADRGYAVIDPADLEIEKDNTTNGDASTLVSTYSARIEKLITSSTDIFGIDVQ